METINELVKILSEEFGNNAILTRKDIINCLDAKGMLEPVNSAGAMPRFLGQSGLEKDGYGKYYINDYKASDTRLTIGISVTF